MCIITLIIGLVLLILRVEEFNKLGDSPKYDIIRKNGAWQVLMMYLYTISSALNNYVDLTIENYECMLWTIDVFFLIGSAVVIKSYLNNYNFSSKDRDYIAYKIKDNTPFYEFLLPFLLISKIGIFVIYLKTYVI